MAGPPLLPPRPHPAVKSPVGFCVSCVVTLLCWTLWLALGALLASLAYAALAREVPVPDFVLRRIESRLAAADLAMRFERVRFDPQGRLLLEGVALRAKHFAEPILSSRLVYVEGSFWSFLAGNITPAEVRLEGATLQLPAMLSPTGTAEPLVQDLTASLRHGEGRWFADQLVFRTGPLAVTAHGAFVLPRRERAGDWTLADALVQYLRLARPAARQLEVLNRFEAPALAVQLESSPGVGNTATLVFTAEAVRWPLPGRASLEIDRLAATTSLRLDGSAPRPLRAHLAAAAVRSGGLEARGLRAILQSRWPGAGRPLAPPEAWLTASRILAAGEVADAPVLHADLAAWPNIRVEASFLAGTGGLAAEVEANVRAQTARVQLRGSVDPAFVNALLARRTPRAAPWLALADPVDAQVRARFAHNWKFDGLEARVAGGRLRSRDVAFDHFTGRLRFDGRELLADDAFVTAGGNHARGSYWMDVGSRDFRILLTGALRPMDIGGWFRLPWWGNIWRDFEFPAAPPQADVDVAGRWMEPGLTRSFVAADAASPLVRTASFDRVRTRLFVRPHHLDGQFLDAVRDGGRQTVRGTYGRRADHGRRLPPVLTFDIDATADPELFDPLLRGAARPVLDNWRFTRPPHLRFAGSWTLREGGGTGDLAFAAEAAGGLHYQGFPLDTLHAAGGLSGTELRLDAIEFTVANGRGRGKASLGGPAGARRLGFDIHVEDANLGPAVRAVQEYEAARTGRPVTAGTDSKFLQRAEAAKLQVALSAVGRPGELSSFAGSGNARLTGATLSEIHLFGLLSQVLGGLALDFSTLKLDTIQGNFQLAEGRLHFPDLKVTGDSAIIEARGDYRFNGSALDFTARFRPFDRNRNIITGTLGVLLNPLTSIIELRLSGPLAQPEWSYSLGTSTPEARPPASSGATVDPPPRDRPAPQG